jgi:uncharacterized protein (TIGR00290 family)
MRPKAIMCWSSGKDSAFALHQVRMAGELDVVSLLTTVNAADGRVAMHAARDELLDRQARALGLPCIKVGIPPSCPNEVYEREMHDACLVAKLAGVTHVVFGDLFLADLRAYREAMLSRLDLHAVFPLWMHDTRALAESMIEQGLRARLCCVDTGKLPAELAGHEYDRALLAALPDGVDPCGENGEFHSFAYAGPMFSEPISVHAGEVVLRNGFAYCDLVPA